MRRRNPFHLRALALPILALLAALASAPLSSALAADPVFPAVSRIGLVPPPDFEPSAQFSGFQHKEKQATILLAELPALAYEAIEKDVVNQIKSDQPGAPTRTDVKVKGGEGFILYGVPSSPQGPVLKWSMVLKYPELTALVTVLIPEAVKDVVSAETVRAALDTVAVRTVPNDEMLAALPFSLNDLAGMRIVRVQPGSAVMLTDGPKDGVEASEQPLLIISIAPMQQPPQPNERDSVARRLLGDIPGLKEAKITRSEPLRIAGQQGFETLIEAKDAKTEQDVRAVQWLRFGTGTLVRMIGISRREGWSEVFNRFREVRDGLGPK